MASVGVSLIWRFLVRFLFNEPKRWQRPSILQCPIGCNAILWKMSIQKIFQWQLKYFFLCSCVARQNRILLSKVHRVSTSYKGPNVKREGFRSGLGIWSILLVGAFSWFHCFVRVFQLRLKVHFPIHEMYKKTQK